jgi:hypothetical protein
MSDYDEAGQPLFAVEMPAYEHGEVKGKLLTSEDYERVTDKTLMLIRVMQDIGYLAGGMARYLSFPDMVKAEDYDFFLYSEVHWEEAQRLMDHLGYGVTEKNANGSLKFRTSDDWSLPVQLVYPFSDEGGKAGQPHKVIESFGLSCEQFALEVDGENLKAIYFTPALSAATSKVVIPTNQIDPLQTLYRAHKYAMKGFRMSQLDMVNQLNIYHSLSDEERTEINERTASGY